MARYKFCPTCATPLVPREDGGRTRQACPREGCRFVFYDNPTPVVAALVERAGHVLLARNKGWPEGWFGLVAGFLERGEDPAEGALREVKEELGVTAQLVSRIGVYSFPEMNQVIIAYHVTTTDEVQLGDELEAYKAVPIPDLKPWPMGTGHAVKDWLTQRTH